ncbi:MAG TPA: ATP-binding protein [Lysobacter sp.]|nr:ATP-binding protein [Lysobacter sp.]
MPNWLSDALEKSAYFMPHGHCILWIPWLLWMHVVSDVLIGLAYVGIALVLWTLVKRTRIAFSPVFVAFALFIGLCGGTHFLEVWTVWNPDYITAGALKAATAAASVATAIGLVHVRPQVIEVVHSARLSEQRRIQLESANAELAVLLERVRELDELKSQFFANVSHELRTPLALILGATEQLAQGQNLDAAQQRQLDTVGANARMLLRHVNDLLDLSRLEAGEMSVQAVDIDCASLVRRVASQFEVAAQQRTIALAVEVPAALPARLDAAKLEHILVNLLSNALKFTPRDGRVRVTLAAHDDALRLEVGDSGPGVPEAHRATVFERFRQLDGGSTRLHGGTGLGLAIVREFAELQGGTVTVADAPEGGALFTVTLPRGDASPAATPAPTSAVPVALEGALAELTAHVRDPAPAQALPSVPGRPQVLVVEDNADMRAFVAETLAARYNVITAVDGQQALEQARALPPDLIVTDVMMPGMSGDQLVAAVRADGAFAHVPILLLTARADDELRVRLLAGGAQDYLTKPFQPRELLVRAGNLLAQKRAIDALRGELAVVSNDLGALVQQMVIRSRQLRTALDVAEVARDHAEGASLVKSHFLGLISHELRTPLATLDTTLQMLTRTDAPPPAPAQLQRMLRVTREMGALVDGLLEYVQLESGRMQARPEPVDLSRLVAEVIDDQREFAPKGVAVRAEQADSVVVHSDPRLLRVVVANLVGNALKFTPAGTVSTRVGSDGERVHVEVRDTGIGIAERDQQRIFEPFEQLEPLARKSIPGVGLGLALVKRIVETLGGTIGVSSELGAGTVFRVELPIAAHAGSGTARPTA